MEPLYIKLHKLSTNVQEAYVPLKFKVIPNLIYTYIVYIYMIIKYF